MAKVSMVKLTDEERAICTDVIAQSSRKLPTIKKIKKQVKAWAAKSNEEQ